MEASQNPEEVFGQIVPFTGEGAIVPQEAPAVLAEVAAQREIAEVQAAMTIAKRFPRNQAKATDRIMVACQRPGLAEKALYSFSRGGTDISGPSIHLLKAIAQQWGNIDFGIRELEQRIGESTVQTFAWDLETNTRETRTFQVRHIRYKRTGTTDLSDPRDIYEMVANLGARRLRACLEGVIPKDVVESAQEQCETTLKAKADISGEAVAKMVKVFGEYGVSKEMIEARIQRKLESITAAQVIALRKIFNSLKDGMSNPGDWFDNIPAPIAPREPEKPERKPRSDKGQPRKATEPPQEAPKDEAPVIRQEESGNGLSGLLNILGEKMNQKHISWGEAQHALGWAEDYKLGELTREQIDEAMAWVESYQG